VRNTRDFSRFQQQLAVFQEFGALDQPAPRRAFLRNLVASSLAFGSTGFPNRLTSALNKPSLPGNVGGVPSLDELAGDWLPMNSLGSYPALNNFIGSLQVTDDLLAVKNLTFPPFSQAGDTGALRINGRLLRAADSRWYAY
jgi:hypothetical protein